MTADFRLHRLYLPTILVCLALALVLTAVSPGVGGVLVRGEKGTAKSTMVRALASLLPDVAVAEEPNPPQAQSAVQSKEGASAKEVAPVLKAKAKPRRKRIDLGRFEGY